MGIAHEDWFWDRLCATTGLEALQGISGPERRARREELRGKLQAVFARKSREEWLKVLEKADVPAAPVNTLEDILHDPHVRHEEMIQEIQLNSGEKNRQVSFPIKMSDMSRKVRLPPPELGEHTEFLLRELGYSQKDIESLRQEQAI